MQTRILHTKIWKDEFFSSLNPTEKLLFVYYLTNERVNIIHCYEVSERETVFDTGIDRTTIKKARERFQAEHKLLFIGNYVVLINAWKYETYSGNLNEKAKEKLLRHLPANIIEILQKNNDEFSHSKKDGYISTTDRGIKGASNPLHTPQIGSINHKSEIRNHKSERGYQRGIKTTKNVDNVPSLRAKYATVLASKVI